MFLTAFPWGPSNFLKHLDDTFSQIMTKHYFSKKSYKTHGHRQQCSYYRGEEGCGSLEDGKGGLNGDRRKFAFGE